MSEPTPFRPSLHADAPQGAPRWYVHLLGRLVLEDAQGLIWRMPGRAAAVLLARLALWPRRTHAREELIELLWPGVSLAVGRNRLRQALSSLKAVLEPAGARQHPVLLADRHGVRVAPGALACDVHEFERLARSARPAEAAALYLGELLPGFYDEWIEDERLRLAALHDELPAPPDPAGAVRDAAAPSLPWSARPDAAALPRYLSRYFVDAQRLGRLHARMSAQRLVVLVGPGGAGKTRTAVEWAATQEGVRRVAFVALSDCRDPAAMAAAVAGSLGWSAPDGPAQAVETGLAGLDLQLLLDNFEQLPPDADALLNHWCQRLPGLRVLVTSRRSLALDGACELAPPEAPLPPEGSALDVLARHPAISLFVDRARAVRPDFHLGPGNAADVLRLVRTLDSLPLALELAAARVRSMPPAALLQALADASGAPHLTLIGRPGGDRAGPHGTLRQVVAWSWQLLPAPVADFAAALSVFRAPFGAGAARAVCAPSGAGLAQVASWLDDLTAQSLLRALPGPEGEACFQLGEPVREFAAEQLAPQRERPLRHRLRQWLADSARHWPATPPLQTVRRLLPTLEAALRSAPDDGDDAAALMLLQAMAPALSDIRLDPAALAAAGRSAAGCTDRALRAAVHVTLAGLCFNTGQLAPALAHARQALADSEDAPAPLRAAARHAELALTWRGQPDPKALRQDLDTTLALAQDADAVLQARLHLLDAAVAQAHERPSARAGQALAAALAAARRSGNRHWEDACLFRLAIWQSRHGAALEALQQLTEVAASARRRADWEGVSTVLNSQGNLLVRLRRWPEALAALRSAVQIAWQVLASQDLAYALWNLPKALARCDEPARALRVQAFAAHYWQVHHGPLTEVEQRYLRRLRRLAGQRLGRAAARQHWDAGEAWSAEEAVRQALGTQPTTSAGR